MGKLLLRFLICCLISFFFWGIGLMQDREALGQELIRMHVVANSDSEQDQNVKLRVRDAVLRSIEADLQAVKSREEALSYLQDSLPKLKRVADKVLADTGFSETAAVTVCREAFPVRRYDTFSLPSGVYDTLRITIGEGKGQNWWCVAFPALCLGATSDAFEDTAVSAGFSGPLSNALTKDYSVRFYLLDQLGKLENRFFNASDCPNR